MATIPFPDVNSGIIKLKHPSSTILAGPSGSGKTEWLLRLIKHRRSMFSPVPTRVIYSYKRYQGIFDAAIRDLGVEFCLGNSYTIDPKERTLLILDDQLLDNTVPLAELFTVTSHHDSCSVIFVSHSVFRANDPDFRLASLNTNYFIVFKSFRGLGQINFLAHQIFVNQKEKSKRLVRAYVHATKRPYGYLLIDLLPQTPDSVRLRADILPDEGATYSGHALTKSYPL